MSKRFKLHPVLEKPTRGQKRMPALSPSREVTKIYDANGTLIATVDPVTRKRTPVTPDA